MTENQQELVTDNLRLATFIAKRFRGRGVEFEDLIAEAHLALVRAALYYDPAAETKFSTYAGSAIERALMRCIHRNYCQYAVSLETAVCSYENSRSVRLEDMIGEEDPGIIRLQTDGSAEAMIAVLPKQERQAATLVFVRGVRQVDAARELGVSQSNISLILKRACAQLRKGF